MTLLWVASTLIAAAAQTARNALQSSLTRAIGAVGATQLRFLFGLPFAILFLALVKLLTGQPIPALTATSLGFTTLGAVAQIAATALMLRTMQARSFAVTTAWIKTEPVLVALIAAAVLGDPLTMPALAAILLATVGVLVTSVKPGVRLLHEPGPMLSGLLAGGLFGLAAIGFRGGILGLADGNFLIRATTILVLSLALQSGILLAWMLAFDRPALRASFGIWRKSLGTGFLGAFASQFWLIGFSLTTAANVRTVALVEVVMAIGLSRYALGQPVTPRQQIGIAIMLIGVALLLRTQT